MALPTPENEARRQRREERLRREHARRKWQRIAIGGAAAVITVGIAIAAFGGISAGRDRAESGTGAPASTATRTVESTPAPSGSGTSKPATATPSQVATPPQTATAGAEATGAIAPLVPAPGKKTIVVSKKKQLVTLYRADGTPIDRFPCASGVIYPRVGTYKIFGKRKQSWSLYDDTTFYYFTKFEVSDKGNSIGFHSIPQEPDGSLVGGLGKPISHGCVRLEKKKAKFIYEWAPIGAKVIVKK